VGFSAVPIGDTGVGVIVFPGSSQRDRDAVNKLVHLVAQP